MGEKGAKMRQLQEETRKKKFYDSIVSHTFKVGFIGPG